SIAIADTGSGSSSDSLTRARTFRRYLRRRERVAINRLFQILPELGIDVDARHRKDWRIQWRRDWYRRRNQRRRRQLSGLWRQERAIAAAATALCGLRRWTRTLAGATLKPDRPNSIQPDADIGGWLFEVEHHHLDRRLLVDLSSVPAFGSHAFKQEHGYDDSDNRHDGRRQCTQKVRS